jgi:Tfp pilus assembly protein PilE
MLVIVVILGILATIAFLRMTQVTQDANLAILKSDLHAAAMAERIHFEQFFEYLEPADLPGFSSSDGVVLDLTWSSQEGFALTGTHVGVPETVCGVFMGPAEAGVAGPADTPGVIACE